MKASVWIGIAAAGTGALILAVLYFHRPEGQVFFPRCTFHQMTGLLCPGCGGLRASHELLHGRFVDAARCNLLFVGGIPAVLGVAAWNWRASRKLEPTARTVWILFLVVAVFTVVRNVPGTAGWLAP